MRRFDAARRETPAISYLRKRAQTGDPGIPKRGTGPRIYKDRPDRFSRRHLAPDTRGATPSNQRRQNVEDRGGLVRRARRSRSRISGGSSATSR